MDHFLKFNTVYSTNQEDLIAKEFSRIEGKDSNIERQIGYLMSINYSNPYLDHAGATLYSEQQIEKTCLDLSKNIYSNPHARNLISKSTEDAIDIVRYQILEHFNTTNEEYSVIFTSSATAALKTIGEYFDYGNDGTLVYLENNHTSVLGMRNYAANLFELKTEEALCHLSQMNKNYNYVDGEHNSNSLFVYPAQCNFSGSKYPLTWIDNVQNGNLNDLIRKENSYWYVVLDAASYVSTNTLDLTKYKPDFVPISFYKIFGYPTGLGALLVKKNSEHVLNKKYFGGGTLLMALSSKNIMIPRNNVHEKFEDGTIPFLSILAIKHGFNTINRMNLNFDLISKHTFSLAQYLYRNLLVMHHFNGNPLAVLYHDTVFRQREHQGGIVNFNLLRPNGEFIGYSEVLHVSNLHGIQIRTGCFCNPGACQRFLELSTDDVIRHFDAGHVCGDQHDLVNNYPTGSVRISFGYMSTKEDADAFLNMIESCFVYKPVIRKLPSNWQDMEKKYENLYLGKCKNDSKPNKIDNISNNSINNYTPEEYVVDNNETHIGTLQQIFIYPIKSCGAFSIKGKWTLTAKGLKYDREWMIINSSGVCLTQKHNKRLCLVKPEIDVKRKIIILKFQDQPNFELSITSPYSEEKAAYICQSKVCGDRIQGWDCGDEVSDWLSESLQTVGLRLLRQCNSENILGRVSKKDTSYQLSLVNKAQFLLINSRSVEWLIGKIPDKEYFEDKDSVVQRFRPNFVVDFGQAFEEDKYERFWFDDISFQSAGKCTRCQMICINQNSGETSKEPLLTLSREFKGKIAFGVYLNHELTKGERIICLGCSVNGNSSKLD